MTSPKRTAAALLVLLALAGLPAMAQLTLASLPSGTATLGQQVVLVAAGSPSGKVTFFDGVAVMGTATKSAGTPATFPVTGLSAGTHKLTARYVGVPVLSNTV